MGVYLAATFPADWNPFGAVLWFWLALGGMGALLVSGFSPLPVAVRHRVLFILPGVMLLGCLFTRWIDSRWASFLRTPYFHRSYSAELDTAFVVCVAFGSAFALDALRSKDRGCRVFGGAFSAVYLALLIEAFLYVDGGLTISR